MAAAIGRRGRRKATQIVSGIDNITRKISRFQSNIKKDWCACVDSSIPAFSMSAGVREGYVAAKKRGVRMRYVTEITTDNAGHCKELAGFVELRHLDGVRGSFAVSEGEFVAGIRGKKSLKKLVYSNVPELVAHQRDLFETLWETAAPAAGRIKALEQLQERR